MRLSLEVQFIRNLYLLVLNETESLFRDNFHNIYIIVMYSICTDTAVINEIESLSGCTNLHISLLIII